MTVLDHTRRPALRASALAYVSISILFIAFGPSVTWAGKDHCRTIELTGAAGPASEDEVELQAADLRGNVLDRSCKVTVQNDECADALAKRLVGTWGNGSIAGSGQAGCGVDLGEQTCGKNLDLSPVDMGDTEILKTFCKHKYKKGKVKGGNNAIEQLAMSGQCPQPPAPGQKAAYGEFKKNPQIEICCYEITNADVLVNPLTNFNYQDPTHCKGKPLGKTLTIPTRIEISLHDRIKRPSVPSSGIYFEPKDTNNDPVVPVSTTSRSVSLDPIGLFQRPAPRLKDCRAAIGSRVGFLVATKTDLLAQCYADILAGKLPFGTDCDTISPAAVAAAEDALRSAAATGCEGNDPANPDVSPAYYGLTECRGPCASIVLGVCSAGNVGAPCSLDKECESSPGASDGKCGNWDDAIDCMSCEQEAAISQAFLDVFGGTTPGSGGGEEIKCGDAAAYSLRTLVRTGVGELLSCQKKSDLAKTAIAGDVTCKEADSKGKVAAIASKIQALLDKACTTTIPGLGLCSSAATSAAVTACIVAGGKLVNDVVGGTTFPETYSVCGNNVTESIEQCDGTDDENCPGLCTLACLCGTGLVTPLVEDLTPCEPRVVDFYQFNVTAGDTVDIQANTVDPLTAANLCFAPGSGCLDGQQIIGDDQIPCTFASPLGAGCPQTTLTALADSQCLVGVTVCGSDCANAATAAYQLTLTKNLLPGVVQLQLDDSPLN